MTLVKEPGVYLDTLSVDSSKYQEQLRKQIETLTEFDYSSKIMDAVIKALDPNPHMRYSIKMLLSLLSDENKEKSEIIMNIGDEYTIIRSVSMFSLTKLQESDKKVGVSSGYNTIGGSVAKVNEILSLYLAEHKHTMKVYNAFCATFRDEAEVSKYYEYYKNLQENFEHENLVPLKNIYLEKYQAGQCFVYVVKVILSITDFY
jgi:hypothetical protein